MELDTIVPLDQENVELFRTYWPPDPLLVQARPGLCLIVMVRHAAGGGVLVALPPALVPTGSLPLEPAESDVIGPHTSLEVPAVRMSEVGIDQIGIDLDVHLVDLGVDALRAITPLSLVPESEDYGMIGFGEDLDIIPDPVLLVERAREWLSSHADHRAVFYSAEEEAVEEGSPHAVPLPTRERRVAGISPERARAKPKEAPKKRVTTAALSEQLTSLMELVPTMVEQISDLRKGQTEMQQAIALQRETPPPRCPCRETTPGVAHFAKMMGAPPKTKALGPAMARGPMLTSGLDGNVDPQTYAEEASPANQADPFAKAMLEQSKALMTLVAHMQQGGDPLLDMPGASSSGSLGTRGSASREKLQRELATRSGTFFLAVLQNAVKRLKPASPKPTSTEEVAATDFSMIQYLERFGGYGQYKELGLIRYALAHIFDALVHSDVNGARDYLALLMVGVHQANLDGNRWEVGTGLS